MTNNKGPAMGGEQMSFDCQKAIQLHSVIVQENGIIRDERGWIIGRADKDWMRYQWRMIDSGICPCCGAKVVDA